MKKVYQKPTVVAIECDKSIMDNTLVVGSPDVIITTSEINSPAIDDYVNNPWDRKEGFWRQ